MIQVRATTIARRRNAASGEPWVDARIEVCWSDGVWLNLGLMQEHEDDWCLLVMLLCLGARRAKIGFEHINLAKRLAEINNV